MKKLLSILGAVGLMATTGISVVACAPNDKKTDDTHDGDDTENGTEIKLQVEDSTIKIDQMLDIKIENYKQIKEILKDFTLEIYQWGPKVDPVLEKVGEFDQEAGKFVVKGLNQGTVEVTVKTYYQDENLGQEPITSALTINVIPAEAQQIGITSDKTELALNDKDEEKNQATIKIDGYEKIKDEWKDFILTITTLDAGIKDLEVLRQTGTFDEEKGEFKVESSNTGKAKVNVYATAIDQPEKQKLAIKHSTFATNEIIITVKNIDFQSWIDQNLKPSNDFGYGLTGAEFIKSFDEWNKGLIKSGKDYEILNLDLEKKLAKDSEIEFKAKESSKILTGSGKLRLVNLDIQVLKEKIKSVEVGLSSQEFQKIVEKEMKSICKEAVYGTDYRIDGEPLVVGEKVSIEREAMSQLLAGEVEIPVVGESYSGWDLDKLNDKLNSFIETMNKLIEQNKESEYPEPIENPKLKDEWAKNYFEMYCFFARVFLETSNYAVVNLDNEEEIEIKEVKETSDYNQAKAELREKMDDLHQLGEVNEEYGSTWQKYQNKLNNKK